MAAIEHSHTDSLPCQHPATIGASAGASLVLLQSKSTGGSKPPPYGAVIYIVLALRLATVSDGVCCRVSVKKDLPGQKAVGFYNEQGDRPHSCDSLRAAFGAFSLAQRCGASHPARSSSLRSATPPGGRHWGRPWTASLIVSSPPGSELRAAING